MVAGGEGSTDGAKVNSFPHCKNAARKANRPKETEITYGFMGFNKGTTFANFMDLDNHSCFHASLHFIYMC